MKNLLDSIETAKKHVEYYALDLSKGSLRKGLSDIGSTYSFVKCFGLWGTFDDALAWSQKITGPKLFLSLGSSFGNNFFELAVSHLSAWSGIMGPADRMLLGMDGTEDWQKIWNSYHDAEGVFEAFIRNGLEQSNEIFGQVWYKKEDWEVVGFKQNDPIMHCFIISAVREVVCEPLQIRFPAGIKIDCYRAFKYGPESMRVQFKKAGLQELASWKAPSSDICKSLSHH